MAKAKTTAKPNIELIIRVYGARQIAHFKTALNVVMALAFRASFNDGRDQREHGEVVAKFRTATLSTCKFARDRE